MFNQSLTIQMMGDVSVVTYPYRQTSHEGDCTLISKTIGTKQLVKIFKTSSTRLATPLLPRGTVRYSETGNTGSLTLFHEATSFTLTYDGYDSAEIFENVKRPNVIMNFKLSLNKDNTYYVTDSKCYGVIDSYITLSEMTPLYELPFPNIGGDGYICWGGNKLINGHFKSLMGFTAFVDILFNSPFNDDLFYGHTSTMYNIKNPKDLFKILQESDTFPEGLLSTSSSSPKLGDL